MNCARANSNAGRVFPAPGVAEIRKAPSRQRAEFGEGLLLPCARAAAAPT